MKNKLVLGILIVFFTLPIILNAFIKLEDVSNRLTVALKEIRVKVPGLEPAYHWVKKLTAEGYLVELLPINEPGYLYEIHGIKYIFQR
jgi:hypothetical protein